MFLSERQWTVQKLLGIMGCAYSRRGCSQPSQKVAAFSWFSLCAALGLWQAWFYLPGGLGYTGRGQKQPGSQWGNEPLRAAQPPAASAQVSSQGTTSCPPPWGARDPVEKEGVDLGLPSQGR